MHTRRSAQADIVLQEKPLHTTTSSRTMENNCIDDVYGTRSGRAVKKPIRFGDNVGFNTNFGH